MSADRSAALGQIRPLLAGRPALTLPAQKSWWGWLRAALAFQPARPQTARTAPESVESTPTHLPHPPAAEKPSEDEDSSPEPPGDQTTAEELRQALHALPPLRRLGLRRHPVVTVSIRCTSLASGLAEHGKTVRDLITALYRLRARILDDVDAYERAAAGAGPLDLPHALAFARELPNELDLVLDFVLDLVRDLDGALDRPDLNPSSAVELLAFGDPALDYAVANEADALTAALGFARDIARELARELARARDRAPVLGRVLDRAVDLDRDRDQVRDRDHVRDLASARALARALDRVEGTALHLAGLLDRAVMAAGALSRSLDVAAGRVLGLPRAEGVGAVLAAGALNDFTDADLSSVDLTGRVDLVGVRWSERGTIWPPGEEERIRRASRETAPRSGVWVVTRATGAADRALV